MNRRTEESITRSGLQADVGSADAAAKVLGMGGAAGRGTAARDLADRATLATETGR